MKRERIHILVWIFAALSILTKKITKMGQIGQNLSYLASILFCGKSKENSQTGKYPSGLAYKLRNVEKTIMFLLPNRPLPCLFGS